MRYAAVGRAAYGVSLLLAPGTVIGVVSGSGSADQTSTTVGRVLGLRHLVQALLIDRAGSRSRLLVGTAVDAVHALSMVVLATLSIKHRRPAALDAALAGGLAANGLWEARNA